LEHVIMALDNPLHIAFLLLILLLVFGAKRLPEMGQSLGAGLRGFKESISGEMPTTAVGPAEVSGSVAGLAAASVSTTAPVQAVSSAVEVPVQGPDLTPAA
jgi:sec-independent protein translocase protein TatA